MTKKEKQLVEQLKIRLKQHIKDYGMDNGYSTSFGHFNIRLNVFQGIDLMLPHSGDKTLDEIKKIGYKLYEDLYHICIVNLSLREFDDIIINIYSEYIEDGCYFHYIELTHKERI